MSSSQAKTAPYGSWRSPITSDLIVAQSIALSEARLDGETSTGSKAGRRSRAAPWSCVPSAGGAKPTSRRSHSTRAPACTNTAAARGPSPTALSISPISPTAASIGRLRCRTRAGAADAGAAGPSAQWRYADGVIDHRAQALDRRARGPHRRRGAGQHHRRRRSRSAGARRRARARARPRFLLFAAAVARRPPARLAGLGSSQHAVERHHALSRATRRRRASGRAARRSRAARRNRSSSRNGRPTAQRLVFVSDRSGWWNLYRFELGARTTAPLAPMDGGVRRAAMGVRHVDLRVRRRRTGSCAPIRRRARAVWPCSICRAARSRRSRRRSPNSASVRADGDRVVFRAGAPDHPASIVMLDLGSGEHTRPEAGHRHSRPAPICALPIPDHASSRSNFRPPTGRPPSACSIRRTIPTMPAPPDERPPLLVKCHGGPTARRSSTLDLRHAISGPAAASPCST